MSSEDIRRSRCARCTALATLGVSVLAGSVAPAHAGSTNVDVRGAWVYDSNVSNAEADAFRESDSIFEFDAIASYRQQLGENSGVVLKGGVETRLHDKFGDLNSLTGVVSAAYVFQPAHSFTAPWFAVSTDFRWRQHEDSDIRDGTIATLAFSAGKQFTDRISAQLRFEFLDRNANEGRVFELSQRILSAVVDYRATARFIVYGKYQYLDGGLVTTAPPDPKFRPATRAVAPDPVFGPGRMAWRLDGRAHTFALGGKYTLAERTALDIGLGYSHADADNDNRWHTWRLGVGVVHRF